jgi:hypothetical protein
MLLGFAPPVGTRCFSFISRGVLAPMLQYRLNAPSVKAPIISLQCMALCRSHPLGSRKYQRHRWSLSNFDKQTERPTLALHRSDTALSRSPAGELLSVRRQLGKTSCLSEALEIETSSLTVLRPSIIDCARRAVLRFVVGPAPSYRSFPRPKVDSRAAGCPHQSALRGPIRLRASLSVESPSSYQPRRERLQLLGSGSAMGLSPSCCRWRPWLRAPIEWGTTAVGCEVVTRRVQGQVGLSSLPAARARWNPLAQDSGRGPQPASPVAPSVELPRGRADWRLRFAAVPNCPGGLPFGAKEV